MKAASFTGGEAEELRRAFGFKRSEKRMKELEGRLRSGMTNNGITGEPQEKILKAIASFAMFGFPESHAASFALLAYASAWLQTYYRGPFTCALLNNQPMGFYGPSTLIKDAQRHGLRVLPVDINLSDAICSVENFNLRLGLNYVKGLNRAVAKLIADRRPYTSIAELTRRVPEMNKAELETLAAIGALNPIGAKHRRDALWQASWLAKPAVDLLNAAPEPALEAPLKQMTMEERLVTDHAGVGFTIGRHPMAHRRAEMDKLRVVPAAKLAAIPNGRTVRVAGNIIVRQRPGTANGILFLSLEDETGISNVVVMPDVFESQRLEILAHPWIMVQGRMQNVDNVIHIKAEKISPLPNPLAIGGLSHNFH